MPAIEHAFGADYGRVQLILSLFLASVALSQIVIGPLSDRFGRRPVLLGGFALFVVSSMAAPFAPSDRRARSRSASSRAPRAASASCSAAPSCATCSTGGRRRACSATSPWASRWRRWWRPRSAASSRSSSAGRRSSGSWRCFGLACLAITLGLRSGNEPQANGGAQPAQPVLRLSQPAAHARFPALCRERQPFERRVLRLSRRGALRRRARARPRARRSTACGSASSPSAMRPEASSPGASPSASASPS